MGAPLKAVIIGVGGHANYAHLPSLSALEGVDLAALCDLDAGRLDEAGDRYGVEARYTDYREMIDRERPDAVYIIVLVTHVHEIAAEVIGAGCNVFIEKPPGLNTDEVRRLSKLANEHGVLSAVGTHQRFAPVIRQGRERCLESGPVHTALVRFCKRYPNRPLPMGGVVGPLFNEFVHAADTLRYLCGGDVVTVSSSVRALEADYANAYTVLATFSSGATGVMICHWLAGRRFFEVEMHANTVSFFGDPMTEGRVYADDQLDPVAVLDAATLGGDEAWRAHGFHQINTDFIACIREGRQPETNLADAVKTMEFLDAIEKGGSSEFRG